MLLINFSEQGMSSLCSTKRKSGCKYTHLCEKDLHGHAITLVSWGISSRIGINSIRKLTLFAIIENASDWIWAISTPLWILCTNLHLTFSLQFSFLEIYCHLDFEDCQIANYIKSLWFERASDSHLGILSIDLVPDLPLEAAFGAPYACSQVVL